MKSQLINQSAIGKFETAIATELLHAQMYRQLANSMQMIGYFGVQKKFLAEIPEEGEHYQKHIDFLNDVGVQINVPQVPQLSYQPKTLAGALKIAFDAEKAFLDFYKEFARTNGMESPEILEHLMQYLNIQRTTTGEYADILARVDLAGTDTCGLLLIDQELGK